MNTEHEVLIEKYRPKKLDDIIGQDDIIKRLKVYVKNKNLPNLLFSGAPGSGKTTAAIAMHRKAAEIGRLTNMPKLPFDIIKDLLKAGSMMGPNT